MARASKHVRGVYVLPAIFVPVFALLWATMGFEDGAKATGVLLIAAFVLAPGILGALFIPVAIHELGHLWAGYQAGYEFESIRIGPITWDRQGRRTDWSFRLPMCLCEMRPHSGFASWREALVFVSGGPLASLAATAVAGLAFALAGGRAEMAWPFASVAAGSLLQLIVLLVMWGNGTGLLSSLVLTRVGGMDSDGLQLLDLWRHRAR